MQIICVSVEVNFGTDPAKQFKYNIEKCPVMGNDIWLPMDSGQSMCVSYTSISHFISNGLGLPAYNIDFIQKWHLHMYTIFFYSLTVVIINEWLAFFTVLNNILTIYVFTILAIIFYAIS
jgi:hypothetical protein